MPNDDTRTKDDALSLKQMKAITLLLTRPSREAVIKEVEISSETLYRWMRDPDFKAELARQQNEVINEAINILKTSMTKAADTLVALLDEKGGELRRRVANDIISHVLKARELARKIISNYKYNAHELFKLLVEELNKLPISKFARTKLLSLIADADFRALDGIDNDIQISALLSKLCLFSEKLE